MEKKIKLSKVLQQIYDYYFEHPKMQKYLKQQVQNIYMYGEADFNEKEIEKIIEDILNE